jgi:glycosyltransferase involved in cell wall biosynthesis
VKILVLTEHFTPEIAAPCFRIRDHARYWLREGHEVTVVTGVPNFPRGEVHPGYRQGLYQEEWIDGVRVIRLWTYMAANKGVLRRALDYLSFMISSILFCWRYPDFDVILATSPPFFTPAAAFVISWLRRRPYVFEIRDLWPASIGAVGMAKGWPLRLLEKFELFLYRRARRIISLTHAFRRNLAKRGIPQEKIDVVTNGVDLREFAATLEVSAVRRRLRVSSDAFLAGYIGTTGRAHGLRTIIDAASQVADRRDIRFLIMGEGAERESLESYARERGATNVTFSDNVPHDEVPGYLAAINLSIVHLRPDPVFRAVIPSKIFESMATKTPILMAVEGEGADIVQNAECGVCIPSGDSSAMAAAVRSLADDRPALREMGQRGARVVAETYDRRTTAAAVIRSLQAAMHDSQTALEEASFSSFSTESVPATAVRGASAEDVKYPAA